MTDRDYAAPVSSYAEARRWAKHLQDLARRRRVEIEARPGGVAAFRADVTTAPLAMGEVQAMEDFHAVLATGILPSELVDVKDFVSVITARQSDPMLTKALGPHRYFCIAMRDGDGRMIGATGSMAFCHQDGTASVHSSYAAILPAFRGLGLSRPLMETMVAAAAAFIRAQGRRDAALLHVIETNAFDRMTLADRLLDEAMAMHPLDRDAYWETQHFREIAGIAYRQRAMPPLDLALKVRWVALNPALTLSPVEALDGASIVRHVRAFDNLLLNEDVAKDRLAHGLLLPDPRDEGLLAPLVDERIYPTVQTAQAENERALSRQRDAAIGEAPTPDLHQTMAQLAAIGAEG